MVAGRGSSGCGRSAARWLKPASADEIVEHLLGDWSDYTVTDGWKRQSKYYKANARLD